MTSFQRVTVFGSGVTAKAVIAVLSLLSHDFQLVDPENADFGVISPGLNPSDYAHYSFPIIGEIEFAYRLFGLKTYYPTLIGITGTNGKSTVASLVSILLDCPVAGNIGVPLIQFVPHLNSDSLPANLSVELSSYQLETITSFSVDVAVLLNLTPDHLNRHQTMTNYLNAKLNILKNSTKAALLIYNENQPEFREVAQQFPGHAYCIADHPGIANLLPFCQLRGKHNLFNASAAIHVALRLGVSADLIQQRLQNFKGLAHRIEFVDKKEGKSYFNDSKGTNPDSTIIALQSFDEPVVLILGGQKKEVSYIPLMLEIRRRQAIVVGYGESRVFFEALCKEYEVPCLGFSACIADMLPLAKKAKPAVVLFSPACASFDTNKNFEERGNYFKDLVHALPS